MDDKKDIPHRSGQSYSDMILRQNPWMKDKLEEGEYPCFLSYRTPEKLLGGSLMFIGAFAAINTLLHLSAFGNLLVGIVVALAGVILLYGGFWEIYFARCSYILVTSKRIIYQKINIFGGYGKEYRLLRSDIKRVRFFKSTVMYRVRRDDGGVSILMNNGKSIFISSVEKAESIIESLR